MKSLLSRIGSKKEERKWIPTTVNYSPTPNQWHGIGSSWQSHDSTAIHTVHRLSGYFAESDPQPLPELHEEEVSDFKQLSIDMEGITLLVEEISTAAKSYPDGDNKAHAKLRNAVKKMLLHIETPEQRISELKFQPLQNFALQIAIETGLLQALATHHGKSLTVPQLAAETGANDLLIIRVLRLLASIGFCKETGVLKFESNKTTQHMARPEEIGAMKMYQDMIFPIMGQISSMIQSQGVNQFGGSNQKAPFEAVFGKAFRTWLQEHPEHKNHWKSSVSGRRSASMPQWFEVFPAGELVKSGSPVKTDAGAVLLVDLGGDKGLDAVKFKRQFASLPGHVIVQDLPENLSGIEDAHRKEVMYLAHDFFNPQPIMGARFYYIRALMHGMNDERASLVLANCAQGMEPTYSSLLIDDFVLPDQGVGSLAASMDLSMMLLGSGQERTLEQWRRLVDAAGLEIVKVWQVEGDHESIIECRKRSGAPGQNSRGGPNLPERNFGSQNSGSNYGSQNSGVAGQYSNTTGISQQNSVSTHHGHNSSVSGSHGFSGREGVTGSQHGYSGRDSVQSSNHGFSGRDGVANRPTSGQYGQYGNNAQYGTSERTAEQSQGVADRRSVADSERS